MSLLKSFSAIAFAVAVTVNSAGSIPVNTTVRTIPNSTEDRTTTEVAEVKTEPQPEPEPEKKLTCLGCTPEEIKALNFFNDEGVTDRKAQATILGTIKAESKFQSSVCEGGAITSYRGCNHGFGLIQWTDATRYYGLGRFARSIGQAPESFDTQLLYLVSEPDWKVAQRTFKTPGLSFYQYERAERNWIRWGIKGNRSYYAHDYHNRIILA